jgi:hypothetical protein
MPTEEAFPGIQLKLPVPEAKSAEFYNGGQSLLERLSSNKF